VVNGFLLAVGIRQDGVVEVGPRFFWNTERNQNRSVGLHDTRYVG
jgi:hypothetical protein